MWPSALSVHTSGGGGGSGKPMGDNGNGSSEAPRAAKRARSASGQPAANGGQLLDSDSGLSCGDSSPRPSPNERLSTGSVPEKSSGVLDFSMKATSTTAEGPMAAVVRKLEPVAKIEPVAPDSSVAPLGVITGNIPFHTSGAPTMPSTPTVSGLSLSDIVSGAVVNTVSASPPTLSLHPLLATLAAAGMRPNVGGAGALPHCSLPPAALLQAMAAAHLGQTHPVVTAALQAHNAAGASNGPFAKPLGGSGNADALSPAPAGVARSKSESKSTQRTGQYIRPFKAYNPHDPLSALQVAGPPLGADPPPASTDGRRSPEAGVSSTSHPHVDAGSLPICRPLALPNAAPPAASAEGRRSAGAGCAQHLADNSDASSPTPTGGKQQRAGSQRPGRSTLPDNIKDAAYWERRRKNNEAAKRSRDVRRQKEDEIAVRAALLERENLRLKVELAQLKAETSRLRSLVPMQ